MDSRYGRGFSGGSSRRYSRSRSRSVSREHNREHSHRRRNSRSRSRDRTSHYRQHGGSADKDLYRDLINEDYKDERNYGHMRNYEHRSHRRDDNYDNERDQRWKNYDREQREPRERVADYDRGSQRSRDYRPHNNGNGSGGGPGCSGNNRERDKDKRYQTGGDSVDSDESDDSQYRHTHSKTSSRPMNTIIVFGLSKHSTEADIMGQLIQVNMAPSSIRLIREKGTGASRGFAFVEFNTVEEATHWMELTQGILQLQGQYVTLQYSHTRITDEDWHCTKCGLYNFKRRYSCFKCSTPHGDSESPFSGGGEGNNEISNILTKKIILRNLDALTNEEGVLTAMQKCLPDLAKTISKVLISRDTLTQTSLGICYLNFETLIDSMNVHNALTALEVPLQIDGREVRVNYCMDHENQALAKEAQTGGSSSVGDMQSALSAVPPSGAGGVYTLADVPRLAEYSASLYASTPAEQAHYVQYYTNYYLTEIKKGQVNGMFCTEAQLTEANSGAAVALSAIQRKQKKMNSIETTATAAATAAAQAAAAVKATFAAQIVVTPKGNDGKTYPTPDVSQYQYDETSGYYYDPSTGLYYDAHSQYYYNNETGAYLYWDQRRSTYILATPASTQAALQEMLANEAQQEQKASEEDAKKDKPKENNKHDKVKVAKKIVKDMEKWAKQLNQKKDYTVVATPQPILAGRSEVGEAPTTSRGASSAGAYADVGFSILEKKERSKLTDYVPATSSAPAGINKLVNAYGGGSDSEEDSGTAAASGAIDELDYVDFQKLTCLLCKRAFQSVDILQKHLKMSNLHKENLAKHNLNVGEGAAGDDSAMAGLSYRDRAKERRLKYGESDPPPPNRSRERFEHEIKTLQTRPGENSAAASAMPISSSNVGSRLLQKMGWSEGQGLGRKNQGRTQIIEADARSNNAGLGTKSGNFMPGDDYKTYIKRMMKARYENA